MLEIQHHKYMLKVKKIIVLFLIAVLASCSAFHQGKKGEKIAKVGDKYLYESDLKDVLKRGMSATDSAHIRKSFIDSWIRKQLMLGKAEMNLTDEEKDVDKQLEDYRTSLLIFKYEQQLLRQKLDTVITQEEIQKYYNENNRNFILNSPIVKALYIKLPASAPYLNKVRRWYRSDDESDINDLESYCYQYAIKYDYFNDHWIYFNTILSEVPKEVTDKPRFLKYNPYFEASDSLYHYFVNIRDYQLSGSVSPLPFVENDIKNILLNKRKINFVKEVENKIYVDALDKKRFEIYK